jgi:hypothetical protein
MFQIETNMIKINVFLFSDTHFNQVSFGSIDTDTNEIVCIIHPSDSFPMTIEKSFEIRPGHNNVFTRSGKLVKSDSSLRSLKSHARKCYFDDENENSKLFKKYSRSSCMFECALMIAQTALMEKSNKTESCIPWFIPSPEWSLNICDPWDSEFFYKIIINVSSSQCMQCLADCSMTINEGRLTAVHLRKCSLLNTGLSKFCRFNSNSILNQNMLNMYLSSEYQHYRRAQPYYISKYFPSMNRTYSETLPQGDIFGRTVYDPSEADVAIVEVYFKYANIMMLNSQNKMTWIYFFSNIGGIFGLILGIGTISLFEVCFLVFKLLFN